MVRFSFTIFVTFGIHHPFAQNTISDIIVMLSRPLIWPHLQQLHATIYVFPEYIGNIEKFESLLKSGKRIAHLTIYSNDPTQIRIMERYVRIFLSDLRVFCRCLPILAEYQCKSITHIKLESGQITDAIIMPLTACLNLTSLTIGCYNLTDISIGYLKVCRYKHCY